MNPRSLPMINALGCLVLAAVVFSQWSKESRADAATSRLRSELATAGAHAEADSKRIADLERDISVLKQSFEATRLAAAVAQKQSGLAATQSQLTAAREQVETWKSSLADRDSHIRELETELVATRRRLDEAVIALKQAGAR
jgi:chromosome segregation ATPase